MKDQKKIIILAEDVAFTAPGIVFRNLLLDLVSRYEITLVTANVEGQLKMAPLRIIEVNGKPRIPHKIEMKMYEWTGCNLLDYIIAFQWQCKHLNTIELTEYEMVISFTSHWHFLSLLLGNKLKKKFPHLKWLVYSVDAIPAPVGWVSKPIHDKMATWVARTMARADGFFSANEQMLEYELRLFDTFSGKSGVVYTPWRPIQINYTLKNKINDVTFLYTGNVYGLRHVRALLKGFKIFNQQYPDSKLVFVGSRIEKDLEPYQSLVTSGRIEVHGFTPNLDSFLANADVLIDIGADVEDDVFLSSKIVNYLILYKPILAITGKGSPARHLMSEDPSIVHCEHNPLDIADCMVNFIRHQSIDTAIRRQLIMKFDPQYVAEHFSQDIDKIINS